MKLLALVICAAAACNAHAQQARRSAACTAIEDCMDTGALCMLVQVPKAHQKALKSEAFEDMESRIARLQAQRPNTHLVVAADVARYLRGLRVRSTLRTVFIGRQGRALVYDGLFVDDLAPVERYLASGELAPELRGHVQDVELALNHSACPPTGPK